MPLSKYKSISYRFDAGRIIISLLLKSAEDRLLQTCMTRLQLHHKWYRTVAAITVPTFFNPSDTPDKLKPVSHSHVSNLLLIYFAITALNSFMCCIERNNAIELDAQRAMPTLESNESASSRREMSTAFRHENQRFA